MADVKQFLPKAYEIREHVRSFLPWLDGVDPGACLPFRDKYESLANDVLDGKYPEDATHDEIVGGIIAAGYRLVETWPTDTPCQFGKVLPKGHEFKAERNRIVKAHKKRIDNFAAWGYKIPFDYRLALLTATPIFRSVQAGQGYRHAFTDELMKLALDLRQSVKKAEMGE